MMTRAKESFFHEHSPPRRMGALKKHIMQVTGFKSVTLAAKAPKMPGRVATGFPLPSTGRGIEGEGWSYPEPPPVRFFLYQPHPGSRLNTSPENPRINTFITMNERLQTRVARATGPYRPATRRTERVRRSFCQRTPFVIGASSFFRHSTFVIRHSQTEIIKNPRNITFLRIETSPHNDPTHRRQPMGGRARHSVRAAIGIQADKLSPTAAIPMLHLRNTLCKCLLLQHVTFASKAPKMPVASPLASLSPQRGEGLRVRGGHIQSRLPSVSSCISPIRGPR